MNGSTVITFEKVRQDADTLKECAKVMRNIFDDFNLTINQVSADDVFLGKASEALKTNFNMLRSRFDSFTLTVEDFSKMIAAASDDTEATEMSIAAEANDLDI